MTLTSLTYVVAPAYHPMRYALMAFPSMQDAVDHLTSLGLLVETKGEKTFVEQATVNGETMSLVRALDKSRTLREALFDNGDYESGNVTCERLNLVERPIGRPAGTFGY